MNRRTFAILMVLACAAVAAFTTEAVAQRATSPNGFVSPQCTWKADWNAADRGWRLQFSQSGGRDAWKWWTIISNAERSSAPRVDSIGVIHNARNGGEGDSGHVFWVKSRTRTTAGYDLTISHSNWPSGTIRESARAQWRKSDGKVRIMRDDGVWGGWKTCRGFLRQATGG